MEIKSLPQYYSASTGSQAQRPTHFNTPQVPRLSCLLTHTLLLTREEEAHNLYALFHYFFKLNSQSSNNLETGESVTKCLDLVVCQNVSESQSPRKKRHSERLQGKSKEGLIPAISYDKPTLVTSPSITSTNSTSEMSTSCSPVTLSPASKTPQPSPAHNDHQIPSSASQSNEAPPMSSSATHPPISLDKEETVKEFIATDKSDEWIDDSDMENEKDSKVDGPKNNSKTPVKKRKKSYPRETNNNPTKIGEIKSSFATMIKIVNKRYKTFENFKQQCNEMFCELITKIEDAKTNTKKELKLHQDIKMQEHEEKIAELEKTVISLQKDNQSLRSQIGDIKAQVKSIKEKHITTPVQTYSQALRSTPPLSTPSSPQPTVNINKPQPPVPKEDTAVLTQREQESRITIAQNSQSTNGPRLGEQDRQKKNRQEEEKKNIDPQQHYHKESETKIETTPYHKLAKHRVIPNTQRIIIGDSVMTHIDPNVVYDSDRANQSIVISGMKLADLKQWLKNVPQQHQIRQIVIHIGINTCKEGKEISREVWCNLIAQIKRVFNAAEVFMSTIIPPSKIRVQADLLHLVNRSNENLGRACKTENVYLVDNNQLFTTSKGLPRKAMYYDTIHPSPKGTDGLINNICNAVLPLPTDPRDMAYCKGRHELKPTDFNNRPDTKQHFHSTYEDRYADHANNLPLQEEYSRPPENYRINVRGAYSVDNTGYHRALDNRVRYAGHTSPRQRQRHNYNRHQYASQPYEVNEMSYDQQLTAQRGHVHHRSSLQGPPLPRDHFNLYQRQRSPLYFNNRYI